VEFGSKHVKRLTVRFYAILADSRNRGMALIGDVCVWYVCMSHCCSVPTKLKIWLSAEAHQKPEAIFSPTRNYLCKHLPEEAWGDGVMS
jgi:hypothetical protein